MLPTDGPAKAGGSKGVSTFHGYYVLEAMALAGDVAGGQALIRDPRLLGRGARLRSDHLLGGAAEFMRSLRHNLSIPLGGIKLR